MFESVDVGSKPKALVIEFSNGHSQTMGFHIAVLTQMGYAVSVGMLEGHWEYTDIPELGRYLDFEVVTDLDDLAARIDDGVFDIAILNSVRNFRSGKTPWAHLATKLVRALGSQRIIAQCHNEADFRLPVVKEHALMTMAPTPLQAGWADVTATPFFDALPGLLVKSRSSSRSEAIGILRVGGGGKHSENNSAGRELCTLVARGIPTWVFTRSSDLANEELVEAVRRGANHFVGLPNVAIAGLSDILQSLLWMVNDQSGRYLHGLLSSSVLFSVNYAVPAIADEATARLYGLEGAVVTWRGSETVHDLLRHGAVWEEFEAVRHSLYEVRSILIDREQQSFKEFLAAKGLAP